VIELESRAVVSEVLGLEPGREAAHVLRDRVRGPAVGQELGLEAGEGVGCDIPDAALRVALQ
jgi:hypothetical protein